MRKIFIALLSCTIIFSFISCKGKNEVTISSEALPSENSVVAENPNDNK